MNYQKEDTYESNDSIEWLCNPQLDYPILQHENECTQSPTNIATNIATNTATNTTTNDILHDNIQQFIEHYGVIDKSSQNKYIKDIRKLIFDWIRIDNIDISHVQKKSSQLFTHMRDIEHICSNECFYMVDTLT
mgnify:CR=1 FL=1